MARVGLSAEEERVRRILQSALDCRVEQWDDQSSPGMYDLVARTPAGDEAAEVVSNKDPAIRQRMAAGRSLAELTAASLTNGWRVAVGNRADIRQIRSRTPAVLAHLEALGVLDVDTRRDDNAYVALLRELHLTHAVVRDELPAGTVSFFTGMSWVGSVMPIDDLAGYASEVLAANPDVAQKLGRSCSGPRHAVIVISPDRMDVLMALDDGQVDLPAIDPDVPEEITDVWLVPCSPGDRILRWTRGGAWQFVGLTAD